jgi:hypothetical protein
LGVLALGVFAQVAGCGSRQDLIIGRNETAVVPEAGAGAGAANGGSGGSEGGSDAGPDSGPPDCASAGAPGALALLHRYSFDGTGSIATDSVGMANGDLLNVTDVTMGGSDAGTGAMLDGNGLLLLDGETGYVNLPNRLISELTDVSIVTWVTWTGGAGFQRIFDFGIGVAEDDSSSQGKSYLAASPSGTGSRLQLLTRATNGPELKITSQTELNDGRLHQVAVVFASNSHVDLYADSVLLGSQPLTFGLSQIDDVNDWIGRSQWKDDHRFKGTVEEFRIYGQALTACEIAALDAAGPNALPTEP